MNDHDPETLRGIDRKTNTSQATISMSNGSHQQSGQHTRYNFLPRSIAPLCAKPRLDAGACLIDEVFSTHAVAEIDSLRVTFANELDVLQEVLFNLLRCYAV